METNQPTDEHRPPAQWVLIGFMLAGIVALIVALFVMLARIQAQNDDRIALEQTLVDLVQELAEINENARPQLHLIRPTEQQVSNPTRESVDVEGVQFCFAPNMTDVKMDALWVSIEILSDNWEGQFKVYDMFGGVFEAGIDHEWFPFDDENCITIEDYTQKFPQALVDDLAAQPDAEPLAVISGRTQATDMTNSLEVAGQIVVGQTKKFRIPAA